MKTVILRTHKRTKSYFFRTLTVAPSISLFSKLATKPTKTIMVRPLAVTINYVPKYVE
jgi:hypothetical protein